MTTRDKIKVAAAGSLIAALICWLWIMLQMLDAMAAEVTP